MIDYPHPKGQPTAAEIKAAWDAHLQPSTRKVANAMRAEGWKVSSAKINRLQRDGWAEPRPTGAPKTATVSARAKHRLIGTVRARLRQLLSVETNAELKMMEERARLIYNIMTLEFSAQVADLHARNPEKAARLMESSTLLAEIIPMIPPEVQAFNKRSNGHDTIDVTPNPNGDAIEAYMREHNKTAA